MYIRLASFILDMGQKRFTIHLQPDVSTTQPDTSHEMSESNTMIFRIDRDLKKKYGNVQSAHSLF